MVLASMCGSSASNGYGSEGTVNGTGFSPSLRFESELIAVPARKKPGAEFPAPSSPAPTIPVLNKKLRRFMGTPAMRNVINRSAAGLYNLCGHHGNSAGEIHNPASSAELPDSRQPAGPREQDSQCTDV